MIFIGIFVFILEGLVCTFLPISIRRIVATLDGQPNWLKAIVYLIISMPSIWLCNNTWQPYVSSLLFLMTAFIHIFMAIRYKRHFAEVNNV